MQSDAKTVSEYLEAVPAERQEILNKLRELCQNTLTGYEEAIDYGMPVYRKDGVSAIAFASQKQYISLYVRPDIVLAHADELKKSSSVGKSCIRYTKPEKIDLKLVETLLKETFAETGGKT